jgi:hypothetical protein
MCISLPFVVLENFAYNSSDANLLGRNSRTYLFVSPHSINHGRVSNVGIFCNISITIGNHVKLGGRVVIYDTNFTSWI